MSSSTSRSKGNVIQLQHVSKKYPIYETSSSKLLELLFFRRWKLHRDFWALRDVSLEIPRGATLGVLGQNGSGKSTLLQVLAGILRPTVGTCQVEGFGCCHSRTGRGVQPRIQRKRKHLYQRRRPGTVASPDPGQNGPDTGFCGDRRLHRSTGQDLFQWNVREAGLFGCRAR